MFDWGADLLGPLHFFEDRDGRRPNTNRRRVCGHGFRNAFDDSVRGDRCFRVGLVNWRGLYQNLWPADYVLRLVEGALADNAAFIVDGTEFCGRRFNRSLRQLGIKEVEKLLTVNRAMSGDEDQHLSGFADLAEKTTAQNLVAWVNEFFGPVVHNGKTFTEMAVVKDHLARIRGVVRIPRRSPDTFGRDMDEMLRQKLTFDEALNGSGFSIMARQRLQMIRREIFEQLDELGLDGAHRD
jgi:hypothetical protein